MTTGKIRIALSVVCVAIFFVGIAFDKFGPGSHARALNDARAAAMAKSADEKRTSMPASKWNAYVEQAVAKNCVVEGMTEDDVKRAIGDPSEANDYSAGVVLRYSRPTQECTRYEGENCVEYKQDERYLFFSPAGHLQDGVLKPYCGFYY